jgi:(S)-ureidoglycine aminohydrolase
MTPLPGHTRTRFRPRHALITPDGHVPSVLPGVEGVRVVAHITPAMGAGFAQSTYFFEAKGQARFSSGSSEYFFYVAEGSLEIARGPETDLLTAGSYAYLPPAAGVELKSRGAAATLVVFEKKFVPLAGAKTPLSLLGHADKITGQPFLGNPRALLQVLLPDEPAFDLAVNIFTYQPGATLPFVETHIMEHGLLMLAGQGIYRLEDDWYPVTAGDVIWMAPHCPQWFVAMGDTPASYLYYKDVNRPPLAP